MRHRTALVLGAGSSAWLGYPTGEILRNQLIDCTAGKYASAILASKSGLHQSHLTEFTTAFRDSQMASIDAFLARRSEYADIGKRAIASVLLSYESLEAFHATDHPDKWLRYLFNELAAQSWEELSFDNLAVISFNYDRSFEHFLASALAASYNRTLDECHAKLKELSLVHVYGSLGSCSPTGPNYFPYGAGTTPETISAAAEAIRVIPEGRTEDNSLVEARRLLRGADRIAFLGFGFDATNLERLDSKATCQVMAKRENGSVIRRVAASCYGMTPAEIRRAVNLTAGAGGMLSATGQDFVEGNCLKLLRETLLLARDA